MANKTYILYLDGEAHAVGTMAKLKEYCELDTFGEWDEGGSDERFSFWVEDWRENDGEWDRKYSQLDDSGPFAYATMWETVNVGCE